MVRSFVRLLPRAIVYLQLLLLLLPSPSSSSWRRNNFLIWKLSFKGAIFWQRRRRSRFLAIVRVLGEGSERTNEHESLIFSFFFFFLSLLFFWLIESFSNLSEFEPTKKIVVFKRPVGRIESSHRPSDQD